MKEPVEPIRAQLTHAVEQALEHMLENGHALSRYYSHLRSLDIPHDLACRLVMRADLRLNGAVPRRRE